MDSGRGFRRFCFGLILAPVLFFSVAPTQSWAGYPFCFRTVIAVGYGQGGVFDKWNRELSRELAESFSKFEGFETVYVSSNQAVEMVEQGDANFALVRPSAVTPIVSESSVVAIPGLVNGPTEAIELSQAIREKGFLSKQFAESALRIVDVAYFYEVLVSRVENITSLDSLKGLKVATPRNLGKFVAFAGSKTTVLSIKERLLAIERGAVDSALIPVDRLAKMARTGVVKNVVVFDKSQLSFHTIPSLLITNRDTMSRVTSGAWDDFTTAVGQATARFHEQQTTNAKRALAQARELGVGVVNLRDFDGVNDLRMKFLFEKEQISKEMFSQLPASITQ